MQDEKSKNIDVNEDTVDGRGETQILRSNYKSSEPDSLHQPMDAKLKNVRMDGQNADLFGGPGGTADKRRVSGQHDSGNTLKPLVQQRGRYNHSRLSS